MRRLLLKDPLRVYQTIYQMTKPEVITVCFRAQIQRMLLCRIAVWCCLWGFPLNLGRTNSPFESIITIFFQFILQELFECVSPNWTVFFCFIPVNGSYLLRIFLKDVKQMSCYYSFLFKETLPGRCIKMY